MKNEYMVLTIGTDCDISFPDEFLSNRGIHDEYYMSERSCHVVFLLKKENYNKFMQELQYLFDGHSISCLLYVAPEKAQEGLISNGNYEMNIMRGFTEEDAKNAFSTIKRFDRV